MTTYLLPCTCSARIPVGAGQAGGHVVCSACGTSVAVPKLRDFRALEAVDAGGPPTGRRWNWRHASMLAGAALAVVAWAAAAVVGTPPRSPIDAETIHTAVMAADDTAIIAAWKSLAVSGVDREATPNERALQRIARFRRGAALGLLGVGAIGALGAAVGGIGMALARKAAA